MVPTQKMARPLTSDANVCRMLWRKASLSGVDTQAWALREAQTAALADVHRKWHIPPAFRLALATHTCTGGERKEETWPVPAHSCVLVCCRAVISGASPHSQPCELFILAMEQ
ncbi:PHD finger protein 14 [Homalodisca vitripennis]|nr:PHD finger protein 14 [Homalodisca vitripennis]